MIYRSERMILSLPLGRATATLLLLIFLWIDTRFYVLFGGLHNRIELAILLSAFFLLLLASLLRIRWIRWNNRAIYVSSVIQKQILERNTARVGLQVNAYSRILDAVLWFVDKYGGATNAKLITITDGKRSAGIGVEISSGNQRYYLQMISDSLAI